MNLRGTGRKNSERMSDLHLALLPGLDGTGKLFQPFIEQFENSNDVTVIPYPTDTHIPYDALVDYIIPLLPTGKPLVILGESYSGPIAIRLATCADLNIHGLVLVATFAKYPASTLGLASRFLPLSLLFRMPVPGILIRRYCFGEHTSEQLARQLLEAVKDNRPDVLAKRAHEGAAVDVTPLLPDIHIPCLYLSASGDRLVPKRALEVIQTGISDIEVAEIKGPHFILQVQSKSCFDRITRFMERIG